MKIEEFSETVEEIENFYQKEISEEQKKIWFQELKVMDIRRFKYVISQVYRTCKFIPKLADIIEINTSLGYSQVKKEVAKSECKKCKGTGYIIYKKLIPNGDKKMEYEYMAVCNCGRQRQYKGWEVSEDRYKSNYYTPLTVEIGL